MWIKWSDKHQAYVVSSKAPFFTKWLAAFLALSSAALMAIRVWFAGGNIDSIGYQREEREEIEE